MAWTVALIVAALANFGAAGSLFALGDGFFETAQTEENAGVGFLALGAYAISMLLFGLVGWLIWLATREPGWATVLALAVSAIPPALWAALTIRERRRRAPRAR